MLITNDVALITFVPLAIIIFDKMNTKLKERWLIPVVVMQTIAANLGSMLTPIGNPQNLYLYAKSGISLVDFIILMLPYTLLAFVLLLLFGIFATRSQKEKLSINLNSQNAPLAKRKIVIYLILFILCILTVAKVLSNWITFIIVFITALLMERQVLKKVDYSLLLTFVGFFIFIGNMGRMPAFCSFLEKVITGNEIITAVVASQAISNVPAALLLSGFTKNYEALIIGTNIGGLGTLIASMASLISFKYIAKETPQMKGKYFLNFTITNILFLLAMLACAKIN